MTCSTEASLEKLLWKSCSGGSALEVWEKLLQRSCSGGYVLEELLWRSCYR